MHGVRAQPLALDHLRIILLDAQRRELPQQDPAQTWLEVVPDDVGIAVVGGVFQVGPYDLLQPVVQPRPNGDGLGRREPPLPALRRKGFDRLDRLPLAAEGPCPSLPPPVLSAPSVKVGVVELLFRVIGHILSYPFSRHRILLSVCVRDVPASVPQISTVTRWLPASSQRLAERPFPRMRQDVSSSRENNEGGIPHEKPQAGS